MTGNGLVGLLALVISAPWEPQGPAGISGGQVENIDNLPVAGAINALAPHPDNANVLYVGSVNGGIWKTTSATSMVPQWQPLTDDQLSPSIGALSFDTADPSRQTLLASFARSSAFNSEGGSRSGLLRTTDGGDTWAALTTLAGRNLVAVEASGNRIVVASNGGDTGTCDDLGLYISDDTGLSFTRVANGIPAGAIDALARDPANGEVLFAAVVLGGLCTSGGVNGIYRSEDFGTSWSKVSPPAAVLALDMLLEDVPGTHVEMAVGPDGTLHVAVVPGGSRQLEGVFFTPDGGASWTALDLPGSFEPSFQGIHPSRQGFIHLSLAADPTNPNFLYVGGDRQPQNDDGNFPNAIGAEDFSGRLFRADLTQPAGFQWTPVTHAGTFAGSAPHADSRELKFDASGQLIDANDGGVYRQSSAGSFFGDWFSLNGNLQITESHDASLDPVSGVILSGNQDTGTTQQSATDSLQWVSVTTGDGGDVAAVDLGEQSLRYQSFSFLGAPSRSVYAADNQLLSTTALALEPVNESAELVPQFNTPLEVNGVNPLSLLIGASNGVYESADQGDTVQQVLPDVIASGFAGRPLIYGSVDEPELIYVAGCLLACNTTTAGQVWLRRDDEDGFTVIFTGLGASGLTAITLGANAGNIFVLEDGRVTLLTDYGSVATDVTGDLMELNPGRLRSLLWVAGGADNVLLVGADRGVLAAYESGDYRHWTVLDMGLPNTSVFELDYAANEDQLLATTLGRGSFLLRGLKTRQPRLFVDSFE